MNLEGKKIPTMRNKRHMTHIWDGEVLKDKKNEFIWKKKRELIFPIKVKGEMNNSKSIKPIRKQSSVFFLIGHVN